MKLTPGRNKKPPLEALAGPSAPGHGLILPCRLRCAACMLAGRGSAWHQLSCAIIQLDLTRRPQFPLNSYQRHADHAQRLQARRLVLLKQLLQGFAVPVGSEEVNHRPTWASLLNQRLLIPATSAPCFEQLPSESCTFFSAD